MTLPLVTYRTITASSHKGLVGLDLRGEPTYSRINYLQYTSRELQLKVTLSYPHSLVKPRVNSALSGN